MPPRTRRGGTRSDADSNILESESRGAGPELEPFD